MGVPKFFRWVTDRYPLLLSGVVNESFETPQIDNLYLDMNGIIHNCSHDNEKLSIALTNAAIIEKVLNEIDRLVSVMVRPLEIVFIAVDGVAPRAKLNQQRARRFKSAKERLKSIEHAKEKDPRFNENEVFDSNCITPGTEFMVELSVAIRQFIDEKIKDSSSLWSSLTVYFSGSEVPGEGEHKIMSFIRELRSSSSYQPNVRHCMNGSDADMIMLSLATHEPHFLVLREVVHYGKSKHRKSKPSEDIATLSGEVVTSPQPTTTAARKTGPHRPKDMQFVRIHVLREYLMMELLEGLDASLYDEERVIDDFVFLTFFVGNDFLPCLPALDIGDDAFDIIFEAYKLILKEKSSKKEDGDSDSTDCSGGGCGVYLVDGDVIDLHKLEQLVSLIGSTELQMYSHSRMTRQQRRKAQSTAAAGESSDDSAGSSSSVEPSTGGSSEVSTKQPKELSHSELMKRQYYQKKFNTDISTEEGQSVLRSIACSYLQGLQWCLSYYSRGCVSWAWYYPHHYGPFLHDLTDLTATDMQPFRSFELGEPFTPFQQLLACLPANSCSLLPACYHPLMKSPSSPLFEYYPAVYHTDRNGKRQSYEAVLLLPFIDKQVLLSAEAAWCPSGRLNAAEAKRNTFGVTFKYHQGEPEMKLSPWLVPGECFKAALIPGTEESLPGYPTLLEIAELSQQSALIHKKEKLVHNWTDKSYFPSEFTIRLLLNDLVNIFLSDLCRQLESLNPYFQSVLNNKCDGCTFGGGGLVNQFYVSVLSNCNLQYTLSKRERREVNGEDQTEQSSRSLELLKTLLSEYVTTTAGWVEAKLQPTCRIDIVPVSIEEEGVRKVVKMNQVSLNIDKSSSYKALELLLTSRIRRDLFEHERVNEKKQYYRSKMAIAIGYYTGEDSLAFLKWLNLALIQFEGNLPSLQGTSLELIYAQSDSVNSSGRSSNCSVDSSVHHYYIQK